MRTIADQKVADYRDCRHQTPRRGRDAVPPGGLSVSLRVQDIVHPRNGKGGHGCRLLDSRDLDRGPQIGLQSSSSAIDLQKLAVIASFIEQNTLMEIVPEQR